MSARPEKRVPEKRAHAGDVRPAWAEWSDERLLSLRLCDLGVGLEGTWVQGTIEKLHDNLARRGLRFRPFYWVSSEWFSPTGVPGIAVPFYLLHPRLMRLERRMMMEVEGGTRDGCLKILRHECGHAFQQAYRLHRRKKWQQHFGLTSKTYPDTYRPNPASRRHVQHLRLFYAQSHPDEDFAETFAVWLGPPHRWRRRYAGWEALDKIEYVDEVAQQVGKLAPSVNVREEEGPLHELTQTLREHYAEKLDRYPTNAPDIYDRDLLKVFDGTRHPDGGARAAVFLRRNRRRIRQVVRRWTGEYEFTLDQVLDDMVLRTRELGLWANGETDRLVADFAMMLAVNTVHFLYSKRNRIPL